MGFEISILNFKHGLSKTFDMEFFMGDLKYKLKSIEGIEKVSLKINNEGPESYNEGWTLT